MGEQRAKYVEIAESIKAKIRNGELKQGQKLDSEHQLCSVFGVSRQTVRRALEVLEKEGLA